MYLVLQHNITFKFNGRYFYFLMLEFENDWQTCSWEDDLQVLLQSDDNPSRVDFLQSIFVQSDTRLRRSKVNLLRSHRWLANGYRMAYKGGTQVWYNSCTQVDRQGCSCVDAVRDRCLHFNSQLDKQFVKFNSPIQKRSSTQSKGSSGCSGPKSFCDLLCNCM